MIKFAFIKLNKLQFETKLVVNKTKTRLVILALSLQVVTSHLNICFRAHVVRISGICTVRLGIRSSATAERVRI